MSEYTYVYILASKGKRLYIGYTHTLEIRIWQHKNKIHPDSFTARYNIDQLVYFERHPLAVAGIAREKELKGWTRKKKIALIVANNPTWRDLSLDWGKPVEPFREPRPEDKRSFGDTTWKSRPD
jgi:putative endonuclease